MRKTLTCTLVAALALSLVAGPASAGKRKRVHESFTAQLAPFPKLAAWGDPAGITEPGCLAGQQDVHWTALEFKAPGKGSLHAYMEGFTGDWDLYILDQDMNRTLPLYRSENDQIQGGAAAEEDATVILKPGQVVYIAACNWLGAPEAEVHYEGVFK